MLAKKPSWKLGSSGSGGRLLSVGLVLVRNVRLFVGFIGAIDSNLDGDLTPVDLLAVHLRNGLLLQLFRRKSNKPKSTALAGLAAGLEFFDHESGNGAKCNFGGGRLVSLEEIFKLLNRISVFPKMEYLKGHLKYIQSLRSGRRGGWRP